MSLSRPSVWLAALLMGLCLSADTQVAAAQEGSVQGRVRDLDGSGVFGATVLLERGETLVGVSDTDRLGSFRIANVAAGSYTIRVEALGYAQLVQQLSVVSGGVAELDLRVEASALRLEGISVEAEMSRERMTFLEVAGATVRDLDVAEVRTIPGVAEPDPVRAIEVLPGVVSTSDFSASFHVRGGAQDQNLILLDGIPLFSPFHLGGLFSVFNADMIERVELQAGGFPAEHGGRVSSVLEIESDPGSGDTSVDAALSLLATRAAVGGKLPESTIDALGLANVRYRASARRSYFDILMKPAFEFPYHLTDFQAIVEGWTWGGDRITLSGYHGRDVFDLTTLDAEDFPLRLDWDWGNDAIGVRWTRARTGGGVLDVRANYSRYLTGLKLPDFVDTDLRSRIQQAQVRADLSFRPSPVLSMQVGSSLERMRYGNRFETGGTELGGGGGVGTLFGLYAQGRWSARRAWLVEAGLRLDGYSPDPGGFVTEIAPRLAVKRFLGNGDLAVKLAVGRYTQFLHSMRDEELPLGLDFWVLAGDQAPHTVSDQLQVGVEGYRGRDWFWSLEGYVRSFDGVATFNTADDPNDPTDDLLRGTGLSYGVDLLLQKESGRVNGWVSLSLLKAERSFADLLSPVVPRPEITYPPIFDRRLDVDVVLSYPVKWGWEGGLRWNLGTGIPFTRALGSYAYYSPRYVEAGGLQWTGAQDSEVGSGYGIVLEGRNASRYPTYHRLDLSLRRSFVKGWGSLTPYLNLVNVYNQRNVLFYFFDYDRSPAVRSGVSMFPVLPTVGLEVRW